MLVLSRRKQESIIIETSDGPITVTPVYARGERIGLGIDAPGCCHIRREELLETPAEGTAAVSRSA